MPLLRPLPLIVLACLMTGCGLDKGPNSNGVDPYAVLGLTASIGGILGALARLRNWRGWVGIVVVPVAAVGILLSGLSQAADSGRFFPALFVLSIMGAATFLIVGFRTSAGGGRFGNSGARLGNRGFRGGGGGASRSW